MNAFVSSSGETEMFSTQDVNYGYWQIKANGKGVGKTIFATEQGHSCNTKMPFGLKDAPTLCQKTIDVISTSIKQQFGIACIDDVINFFEAPNQHLLRTERY